MQEYGGGKGEVGLQVRVKMTGERMEVVSI